MKIEIFYLLFQINPKFPTVLRPAVSPLAPAGIFSGGGSEVHQGRACKGGRRVGGSGGLSPPDAGEVFKKFVKDP